jgi:membrane protein YdbS with pleckstrin-like domain
MQINTSQTKQCPFCAETILAAAVKCRYCGEFLNTERAKIMQSQQSDQLSGEVLYSGRPTLWLMAGAFVRGGLLLAIAIVLIFWHIEQTVGLEVADQQAAAFAKYRLLAGLLLGLVVALVLFHKTLKIRMTHYAVSADRIEYGTGIFDRKVDNLDMFRVIDIKLRRSFFDCMVGVGTVSLTTTDKSHPQFVFKKVRNSQQLYDIVKKASLSADRRTNVIHME